MRENVIAICNEGSCANDNDATAGSTIRAYAIVLMSATAAAASNQGYAIARIINAIAANAKSSSWQSARIDVVSTVTTGASAATTATTAVDVGPTTAAAGPWSAAAILGRWRSTKAFASLAAYTESHIYKGGIESTLCRKVHRPTSAAKAAAASVDIGLEG